MKAGSFFSISVKPLTAVAVASLSFLAIGKEYYVDCTRPDDSGDGLSVETAKRTIQAAVDLTNPRGVDIVTVLPGVYDEGKKLSPGLINHEYRVVITNHLLLRSRDGAAKTIIKGSLGSDSNNLGTGAVRGIYMMGPSYVAVEGFTITGCATTNTVASGNDHYGAAVVGSWNQYVLGCVISNNYALSGAGIYGCNAGRCLFTQNKASSSSVGVNGYYWNSVMANNIGGSALSYAIKMVNCTCTDLDGNIAGGRHQVFDNCVLLGNGGDNGVALYTALSNSVTDSASSVFKSIGDSVTSASKYQLVAPAFGDWRLIEGSPAVGRADWNKYYKFVLDQKLIYAVSNGYLPNYLLDEYLYRDYAGNPISAEKSMDAGAIQGAVKIEGGRLDFISAGFHIDGGVPCRMSSYVHAEKWPKILVCRRTSPDGKRTFGCKVSGTYVSDSRSYKFPDLNDRYDFAFPPKDLNSEITAYAVQRTYYVDDNGNDENDGSSPEKAFATLQKVADTIKKNGGAYNFVSVAPGVYKTGGSIGKDLKNRLMVSGQSVQFCASEGPDVTFIEGEPDPESDYHGLGPNATRCLYWYTTHKEAAMRGFTFRNGHTSFYNKDTWNVADANMGGAVYIAAEGSGKVQLLDCVFANNTALISSVNVNGDFTRCRFVNNAAINKSGSVGRNATYRFCSFCDNTPNSCVLDNSVQNIYFCSIEGRAAAQQSNIYGSIIVNPGVASESISKNTDFDGNVVPLNFKVTRAADTVGALNYVCADPMFVNIENGDMHILANSPALGVANVANITSLLHHITVDLDGNNINLIGDKITAGAYQVPSMLVMVSGRENGIKVSGGVYGANVLRPGSTITVKAAECLNGRKFAGFIVNNEKYSPVETTFEFTVPTMPAGFMTIEALYDNLGTVMVIR